MASCAVKTKEDWLLIPGIAHTSIKELEAMGRDKRERRAVILSFNDTVRDQNIKRNHERLMNNLRERYVATRGEERSEETKNEEEEKMDGEEKKEKDNGDEKKEKENVPSFGTLSGFCDMRSGEEKKENGEEKKENGEEKKENGEEKKENGEEKKENGEEKKENVPSFGTISGFCNKRFEPDKKRPEPLSSSFPNPSPRQRFKPDYSKYESRGRPYSRKNAVTDHAKQVQQCNNHMSPKQTEIDNVQQQLQHQLQPQQSHHHQQQPQQLHHHQQLEQEWSNGEAPKPLRVIVTEMNNMHWNKEADKFSGFGVWRGTTERLSDAPSSMTTPLCSTPTESKLHSLETSPVFVQRKDIEVVTFPTSQISPTPAPPPVKKSDRVSFEKVQGPTPCPNPTLEEKVRRWDKEPTAAGKRYTKPLDKVQNSEHHQLQTQIKFDKRRVKRWVSQFNCSEEDLKIRRRRNSDPCDDVYPVKNLVVPEVEPEMDEEMTRAAETFVRMHGWMENVANGGMKWALEDARRVDTPTKGDLIIVRVVEVRGRRATIVPASEFVVVEETLKSHVATFNPPACPSDLDHEMVVIVDQESDIMGVREYRRGWIFDKGEKEKEMKILLMDERRIVSHPLASLAPCPYHLVMCSPPLCVSAIFDREVQDRESELLIYGCTAQCRVMGGGENGEPLKLRLMKINSEGVTLGELFCSEDCAGACEHHRNNPVNREDDL